MMAQDRLAGAASGDVRTIFEDVELDRRFRRDGFVVLDGVTPEELSRFRQVIDEVYVGSRFGFHATIQSGDFDYRRAVFENLGPAFEALVGRVLHEYESFTTSFLIKWQTGPNEFVAHQDWTMVEEPRYRAVNLWVPLQDTDEVNGTLSVLPGSHLVLDHLRCSPMNPIDFLCDANDITVAEMHPVPVRAGQVLVFDSGLLHASGRNASTEPREVVVAGCKPVEAPLMHYYLPSGDSWDVEAYEVPPRFFADFVIGQRPAFPCRAVEQYRGTPRKRREILELSGGPSGSRPGDPSDLGAV